MKFMQCTTCKETVIVNNTGMCLQCQGFLNHPQKDVWQKNRVKLSETLDNQKIEYDKCWENK